MWVWSKLQTVLGTRLACCSSLKADPALEVAVQRPRQLRSCKQDVGSADGPEGRRCALYAA